MKTVRPTTEFVSRVIVKEADCKVFQERCEAHKVNFMIDPLLFENTGSRRSQPLSMCLAQTLSRGTGARG